MIFLQSDQLSVATLLSGTFQDRIYRAVVPPGEVVIASSDADLTDRVSAAWSDAAVVEPRLVGRYYAPRHDWPDLAPLVAYVRLSHEGANEAIRLARWSPPVEVVFYGHGDDPVSLRERLLQVRGSSHGRALLHALTPTLAPLPDRVRTGVTLLCQTASPRDTVSSLAAQCCTSEATLARQLKHVGILRPQHLVVAARLVRAYHILLREELSAMAIAHAVGVASVESLDRQLRATVQTGLAGVRAMRSLNEFVERAAASIVTPAATAAR